MNLIIGLAAADQVTGGKQTKQLANGWMGWESQTMRRARTLSARALVALATLLAPEPVAARRGSGGATTGLSV